MNCLPFADNSFSWVLSLFGSFGYHDDHDNILVIKEISRVLKLGGNVLLDIWNLHKAVILNGEKQRYQISDNEYVTQRYEYNASSKRMIIRRWFQLYDTEREFAISFRVYSQEEITDLLMSSGLTISNIYGGYDRSEFTPQSRNMVIIGVKYP